MMGEPLCGKLLVKSRVAEENALNDPIASTLVLLFVITGLDPVMTGKVEHDTVLNSIASQFPAAPDQANVAAATVPSTPQTGDKK